jgi:hypothetical protein
MHAACDGEEKENLVTPQTPAGGLRPPAPPLEELSYFLYMASAAARAAPT